MSDGLTLEYHLKAGATMVTVEGAVGALDCTRLQEGLDLARCLRPSGPIVVDLSGVDSLALAALVILDRAATDARRAGRALSVRNLRQENITDPGSLRVLECAQDDSGPLVPASPGPPALGARAPTRRRSIRRTGNPADVRSG